MSTVNFGKTVTLQQAADLILASPDVRFLLQGEPGIGKSSLMKYLAKMLPTHSSAYIDVPNMDLGDISMPVVNRDMQITEYFPNGRFQLHKKKPIIIMLDEFTKGSEPVRNMLHPLLEISNPRLGDVPLPEGSIVFLTGNLTTDGVGDALKQHSRNRIVTLHVRKPDADEWLQWAVGNNVEPIVMAWVRQYPHAMASYTDEGQADNPYIFNPRKGQTAFVSPRSLETSSRIVRGRDRVDHDALIAGLIGTIGEAGARDMQAFIAYQDDLEPWDKIISDPKKAKVPDSAGACAVLVYGAIMKITKETITPFMTYLQRFQPEWQAAFALCAAKDPTKQSIVFSSKAFADWMAKNEDIL